MTKNTKKQLFELSLIFGLVILVSYLLYEFPKSLNSQFIWETDGLLAQAQIQSIIDSGPLGATHNLGYPFGFSQWSTPEFSLIYATFIWSLGNLSFFTNFGIYIFIGFLNLLLNSLYFYKLARLITNHTVLVISATIVVLLSPFVTTQLGHPHVMPIFLPIMLLIYIFNFKDKKYGDRFMHLSLFFTTIATPLFWINSVLILLVIIFIPVFLVRIFNSRFHDEFNLWGKALIPVFSGFFIYLFLILWHRNLNTNLDRGTWHSDIFAGKFTDFILGSPFLNSNLPILLNLVEGESTEAKYLRLGLILSVSALFAIFFAIIYKSENLIFNSLRSLTIAAIALFLVGGFGNLQAGFFALFESSSPMRSWARISILIALIGFSLIIYLVNKIQIFKLYFLSITFSVFAILDFISSPKPDFTDNYRAQEQYNSVAFIAENIDSCPVLQLPVDTYLLPQGHLDNAVRYYWNGKIPYILAPDFKWTASTYVNSSGWQFLSKIPTEIDERFLKKLSNKGYCAILFDSDFSNYQKNRNAVLDPSNPGWPGLSINSDIKNDYEDSRFKVILIG
jgi:hypothetical protein